VEGEAHLGEVCLHRAALGLPVPNGTYHRCAAAARDQRSSREQGRVTRSRKLGDASRVK
jgi:hypothetical protein